MSWQNPKSLLVPIDFSDASFQALEQALATVESRSAVHVIHVVPDVKSAPMYVRDALESEDRMARSEFALRERLEEAGHGDVDVIVKHGEAGEVIAETASELDCDLIVIPSHGREGLERFFLGSVAARVLRQASCPVLVLRIVD